MKKYAKKLFSVLIGLTLLISTCFCYNVSFVSAASATEGSCGTSTTYKYDEETTTLTISGTGATSDYNGSINKSPWYSYKANITKLVVEEGVTELGNYCFSEATSLTDVSLPSTLVSIHGSGTMTAPYGCFQKCTSLTSITLPENLETIGRCAFTGCTALTKITIPDSVTTINYGAFSECTALTNVTFGSGLESTGDYSFYNAGVKSINWGLNMTTVSQYSFFGCSMTAVNLPDSITSVGLRAFSNGKFLKSFTVNNQFCSFTNNVTGDSSQTVTVYGHKSSTAETYASSYGYDFVSIDPCEHETTEFVTDVSPTCTTKGHKIEVCTNCNAEVSEADVDALGHYYKQVESIDNTEIDGHIYLSEECTRCGETRDTITHQKLTDGDTTYVWIDGNYTYTNTATCTKPGVETYTCNVEGCSQTERHVSSAGQHKVDSYTITKAPTCTESGTQEGVCSVCGETVTQTVSATGHSYDNLIEDFDNSEDDGHIYHIYLCPNCQQQITTSEHIEWVDEVYTSTVVKEASCTVSGLRYDTCIAVGCDETRTVVLPANGEHQWVEDEDSYQEPTCTVKGSRAYTCSVCGKTKTESVDALGHDYVLQDSGSKEPTCLESGSNLYQCSRCKITKQVTLSALGHTVDESTYKVVVEPDCETTGRATANCSVCYTEYDITLDALGHDYEDVETECEEGHTLITPTCTRCGQTGTQSKRHDQWIEGHYTTADGRSATCAIEGYTTDTCTDCGTTRRNTIPTTAHNYAIRSVDSTGTLTYRCSKCYTSITKTSTEVFGYWNVRYINQEPNIDNESLYLDVNGDGIINAKDFAMLYNYSKIEALHKATEENSNTETDENSSEDTSTETEEDNQ